jgi:hypothetical protein
MWMTRDGHVLGILAPHLAAIASRTGVPEEALVDEIGRLALSARRVGTLRHRATGARYPVFAGRSGGRTRRLVTRPVAHSPARPIPPPWPRRRRWPWWPWAYWPGYAIVGVDPYVVEAPPAQSPLDDEPTPDDDADVSGDPGPEDEPDDEIILPAWGRR